MISMAQMEQMFQLFQKMTQKLEQPIQIENLNHQNYTTWCKEMKVELGDRGMLNHIYHRHSSDDRSSTMETKGCQGYVMDSYMY